jgi:iron complex transport system substrate-binding protein
MRIYSFLPSATEIVCALGLGDELYGVSSECDYPPMVRGKPVVVESSFDPAEMGQREIDDLVVGSLSHGHPLYRIDRELLLEESPDLIITQELCDVCSVSLRDVLRTVSELSAKSRVISLKPQGLAGVMDNIVTIGAACGVPDRARKLVGELEERIGAIRARSEGLVRLRVFFAEWYDPVFAAGHWVPEMVQVAGGSDGLATAGEVSRKIDWARMVEFDPEVLILSPCGFGLERALSDIGLLTGREGWGGLDAVKNGRVYVVDSSSYFSRPGPRLVDGIELLARMIHPQIFGDELPQGAALRIGGSALATMSASD